MAIDERYMTSLSLQEIFADKDSGLLLAGGTVEFFSDTQRATHKFVYELTGSPPNYTYTALPTTMTLGTAGQFVDNDGNDIKVYYYPYDADGNLELYYIEVKNSAGTLQFTREGFPNLNSGNDPTQDGNGGTDNMLSNPQFSIVNFEPDIGMSIPYTGSTTTESEIAPGWILSITHTGAGTVTVARNSLDADQNFVNNPPYSLTITPDANITQMYLYQRLYNDPGIWTAGNGDNDPYYVAASITTNSGTALTAYLQSQLGTEQQLLNVNNVSGTYEETRNTTSIPASDNSQDASGYTDFQLRLATGAASTITCVQAVGTNSDEQNVRYKQDPINRQQDYLFHYYNDLLQEKPIPSYLVGWDFPRNPAQWGPTFAATGGANTSHYVWDQTIVFQTTASGFSASRDASGALKIEVEVNNTSLALIQYIEADKARELLTDRMCVNIEAKKASGAAVNCYVRLYYTADNQLPDMGSNASLVSALTAAGVPTLGNGTWVEVDRSNLGVATGSIAVEADARFSTLKFKGWDAQGAAAIETADYMAIVVSFDEMDDGEIIDIQSISLQSGDIPTKPAPQSESEALLSCQRYYWKTFDNGTVPAQNAGANTGYLHWNHWYTGNFSSYNVRFPVQMYYAPTVTTYNPAAANTSVRDFTATADYAATIDANKTAKGFLIVGTKGSSIADGSYLGVHATADARLGIVNV